MPSTNAIMVLIGICGIGTLTYGVRLFRTNGAAPTAGQCEKQIEKPSHATPDTPMQKLNEQMITLEVVSQLWKTHEMKKIPFAGIAHYWRNMETIETKPPRVIAFQHSEVTAFFEKKIKDTAFFTGTVFDAVVDVLEMLDKFGDCPSVVNLREDEPESKGYAADIYAELAKVPLYLHSIHVAEEAITCAKDGIQIPKLVITALCHDLGKLPDHYLHFYKSGQHPFGSLAIVESIESVSSLKYINDIKEAVRNHHSQSESWLDNVLRDCDQAARRKEISALTLPFKTPPTGEQAVVIPQQGDPVQRKQETTEERTANKEYSEIDSSDKTVPVVVNIESSEEKTRSKRKLIDISSWFDVQLFLKDISKVINTALHKERFWSVLELNGYVYVKPIAMWEIIRQHSFGNAQVTAAGSCEQTKDNIIYTVVSELRKIGAIATHFFGEGYFGQVFYLNPNSEGKGYELFLIPFKAEVFGDAVHAAEQRRTDIMKQTIVLKPKVWKTKKKEDTQDGH